MSDDNETDADDFPTPAGFELCRGNSRPGEPLHPGKGGVVNRGNHPLQPGDTVAVWIEYHADGHHREICRGDLRVIGDDGDGDVFAILAGERPLEASCVFRINNNLRKISISSVVEVPEYDAEACELTVTRKVKQRGDANLTLKEARKLDKPNERSMYGQDGV